MFDMLDDDIDLGYVPTAPGTKSRAGSMKKLTKKEPNATPQPKASRPNASKVNEFDDLLDDILEKQSKALGGLTENKSTTKIQMAKKDSFDSYFDDLKPKSPKKTQFAAQDEPKLSNFGKKTSFMDRSDEIIHEDLGFGKSFTKPTIGTTGQGITSTNQNNKGFSQSKADPTEDLPIFTSSRNMKPPLKKRDSQTNLAVPSSNSPTLTMPEELNLTLSSNRNEEEIIRPPPRLMSRKPSAELKLDRNDEVNMSANLRSQSLNMPMDRKQTKREESSPRMAGRGLFLTMDQPKIEKKEQSAASFSFVKEIQPDRPPAGKQLKLFERESNSVERPKQELRLAPPPRATGLDMKIDQSMTWKQTPPASNITAKHVVLSQDYERQIQQMKKAFQKQIDFMQQNLEKQISINRQTRQKIMQESNKLIEEERGRSKKIFEEELARQREMFEWEKKRMEDNYLAEIAGLKQNIESAARNVQMSSFQSAKASREDVSYLQLQLNSQKKILEDRERVIDKREIDLEQRQNQLSRRRKREEERLRDSEKKMMELEMKLKKQAMEEKRALAEEKQQMAMELASLEIEAMRKKEKADFSIKQNRLTKEAIDNERTELRMANAELMSKYRAKCNQLQQERERIQVVQQQLIKKLRVVELRSRETSAVNRTMCQKKENNWVADSRPVSMGKRSQKPMVELNRTKDRFLDLQCKSKDKLNISVRESGHKFDLDHYMMTVDNYNKMKAHA